MSATTINAGAAGSILARVGWALLFWVPWSHKPGFLAFLVAVGRATLLGIACVAPAVLVFGPAFIMTGIGRAYAAAAFVIFEELARFSYAAKAENKTRALVVFLALILAVETVAYHQPGVALDVYLASRAPAMAVHLAATLAFQLAFRRPSWIVPVVALVTLGHITFDHFAPQIVTLVTGGDAVPPANPTQGKL